MRPALRFGLAATLGAAALPCLVACGRIHYDPIGDAGTGPDTGVPRPDAGPPNCDTPLLVRIGGAGEEGVQDVAADGSGLVYGLSNFRDPVPLPGLETPISAGEDDALVVALDTAGVPVWATAVGGSGDDEAFSIAARPSGGAVIGGRFMNRVDAGGTTHTSRGQSDAFLASLAEDGAVEWLFDFGSREGDRVYGVTIADDGDAIGVGNYSAELEVAGRTHPLRGTADAFVTRVDRSGAHVWTTTFGGTMSIDPWAVAPAPDGGVFVAGHFYGPDLVIGMERLTSAGGPDAFIVRLDANGIPVWARRFGAVNDDAIWDLARSADGVCMVGFAQGSVVFDDIMTSGNRTGFVACLTDDGTTEWMRRLGGNSSRLNGLVVDPSGVVTTVGWFSNAVGLDGETLFMAGTEENGIALRLGPATLESSSWFRGTAEVIATSVARDGCGRSVVVGGLRGEMMRDGTSGSLVPDGPQDGFVLHL